MAEGSESLGPISYLVVEFPGSKMTGEGLPILVDLVDQGVIRILDLVFVAKGQDGSLGIVGLADLDHDGTIDLAVFEGVSSGLVSQEDLADAAPVIAPGSSAAILIFENRWATPFVQALRRGDAQLVAAGYIPQDDLAAALDAADRLKEETDMPLLRGIARTAAIAGTATAVSNRVSRRQRNRWAQQETSSTTTPNRSTRHRPTDAPARDQVAQLKDLAELKSQGILTDAEFDAQKAKILAGT